MSTEANEVSPVEDQGVGDQPLVTELCRFCKSSNEVNERICDDCQTELHILIKHERFKGSGLELPPEEIDVMTPSTLRQWCDWAKRMDGGGGSRGFLRQGAIDSIFSAAKIGMTKAKRCQKQRDKIIANHLRALAENIEGQSQ